MLGWPRGAIEDSPSLGIMPGSQYIGVILIEGKIPVSASGVPPPKIFQRQPLGPGAGKTPPRFRIWSLGFGAIAWYLGSWSSY